MTKTLRLRVLFAVLAAGAATGFVFILPAFRAVPASSLASIDHTGRSATQRTDRLVEEILKRPLFTPGRQPPPPPEVAKAEPPVLQSRLAGVMLRPDIRVALFAGPGGRPISVKEGDVIDGWTASRIEASQVVLTSAFGEKIVKPTNGTADENLPARRLAQKSTAKKNQPALAVQPQTQTATQNSQQLAAGAGSTGQ